MSRLTATVLLTLTSLTSLARELPAQTTERVLIPLAAGHLAGAYDSLWTIELWAHNTAAADVDVQTRERCMSLCQSWIRPGTSRRILIGGETGGHPGLIAYVRPGADGLFFHLRAQDISRQALTWGTELPVVHERDMTPRTLELLNVPTDARFRVSLRLYAFDVQLATARVRVFNQDNGVELTTFDLTLATPVPVPQHAYKPAYVDVHALAQSVPALATGRPMRIEVELLHDTAPFWAFASVTNNETQHFTTVTPRTYRK